MAGCEGIGVIERSRIIPLAPVDWGGGDLRDVTLLELTTQGATGLGSAYTGQRQLQEALTLFEHDPDVLHTADAGWTIPMSAIDIALWDIRGIEQNLPVSELLGGRKHDRVLAYATVDFKALRTTLDQGFRAVKLCIDDFGHRDDSKSDKEWDRYEADLIRAARSIAGKDIQLMLDVYSSDPNWSGDFDWALKTSKVLEEEGFLWFEEPLAPDNVEDFALLTESTNVAISGAEDFIILSDFENLSDKRALNILQPDCTRVGGLTQMQSIRDAASQNGIHVIPHGYNTAIGLAADLQFQSTTPDEKYCVVEVWPHESITGLLKDSPFSLDSDGKIAVPTSAGLGVQLKEEFRHHVTFDGRA